jgi:hypothetical protein
LKAALEIAMHEEQDAQPRAGIGVLRVKRNRLAQRRDGVLVASGMVERGAKIAPGVGEIGTQRDGAAVRRFRLIKALEREQRVAEIAVCPREIRFEGDGTGVALGGLRVSLLLVKRDAEIAERFGIVGLKRERAPGFGDRELRMSGEPMHFAEIGTVEGDLGGERDRAAKVIDRFREPAVLVGRQRQQVEGDRLGGPGRQDVAAERLRLAQAAGAKILLGKRERAGKRQRRGLA